MGVKVSNNAFGTLSAGINTSDTTITVDSGQGARFPSLGANEYFFATLVDTSNNLEIVKVTARSTDSMTVVRAQDNTTAAAFSIGDRFELRPVAALFEAIQDEASVDGITSSAAGTAITIDSSNNTTIEEDLTVDGKIGVGTSNPSSKLQIQNDSSTAYNPASAAFNTILGIKNNTSGASNNAIMSFSTESNGEWYIGGVQNSGNNAADFVFASRASGARAERMRIDFAGRVTLPYQPSFQTYDTSASIASNGVYFIQQSTDHNVGSHFNTSNGRFTAPVAGYYAFHMTATPSSSNANPRISFDKNGSHYIGAALSYYNSYSNASTQAILYLSANDYIRARIEAWNNATCNIWNCSWGGRLVG